MSETARPTLTETVEAETPFIVTSDGGPVRIIPTSHDQMIGAIRTWMDALDKDPSLIRTTREDLLAMARAAIVLIEVDESTGISIETFGEVGELVSRVVGHAFSLTAHGGNVTVHFPVH